MPCHFLFLFLCCTNSSLNLIYRHLMRKTVVLTLIIYHILGGPVHLFGYLFTFSLFSNTALIWHAPVLGKAVLCSNSLMKEILPAVFSYQLFLHTFWSLYEDNPSFHHKHSQKRPIVHFLLSVRYYLLRQMTRSKKEDS